VKKMKRKGIRGDRVRGWEEYYKEHYHYPDGERIIRK